LKENFKACLLKLKDRQPLSPEEMTSAMATIMSGAASDADIEAFLTALHEKGETVSEIAAAALAMRRNSLKLSKPYSDLLDTCGTGGDAKNTLNVSTLSAIIAASVGVRVAKHGNRSVSSTCGSADLLEMLGVVIDLPVSAIGDMIESTGFGFFFAPKFHPATRFAMPARKKIGGKTLFNILGPLSNPAGAAYQVIGVYEERLVEIIAQVLLKLGLERALVVYGMDGVDEISLSSDTKVAELKDGQIRSYVTGPEAFGLKRFPLSEFQCASKEECKQAALKVLKSDEGPKTDLVCLSAGAAIYTAGRAASIKKGFESAKEFVLSGRAYKKLEDIISFSQRFKTAV